jgi:hypothetical protein
MNHKSTITMLQNLFFSETKPAELKPVDLSLLTYLILRRAEDHYIHDSQLTLANRLGCERQAIRDGIGRLDDGNDCRQSVAGEADTGEDRVR